MFTGIITDIATIQSLKDNGELRARLGSPLGEALEIGASIACDGICLTVVAKGADWFEVEISAETLTRTAIETNWQQGAQINLERALRLGDELGGHLVAGHVDCVAKILSATPVGDSTNLRVACPPDIARFIAPKGSVTLNGVSLTVNAVADAHFEVNVIPHTLTATNLGNATAGGQLNLEIDTLARYIARLIGRQS